MREENGGTLRAVAWSEICPWLNIFRVFRIAVGFRVLTLATVGLLLTVGVWGLIAAILGPGSKTDTAQWINQHIKENLQVVTEAVPDEPGLPEWPVADIDTPDAEESRAPIVDSVVTVWLQLTEPLRRVLTASGWEVLCLLLFGLTSLAIWAFFGGAITRIASVELACGERVPMAAALRFACARFWGYFTAPLVPLGAIILLGIPIWFLGVIIWFGNVGVLLVSFFWFLALLAGFIMTLFLVGLLFGWPLMWGTISTEGTDSFDALSRSYAYVFQRPLHFLFYTLVATVLGALGWLLVWNFAACIIQLTYWSASWGCGGDRIAQLATLDGVGGVGFAILNFWVQCVKFIAVGFIYGYFWVAASAIYLLLRRDVDATEMDEVYLEEDAAEETYGLPPLATDETGAPVVKEELPGDEAEPLPDESAESEAPEEESAEETDESEAGASDESSEAESSGEGSEEGDSPEEDKLSEER